MAFRAAGAQWAVAFLEGFTYWPVWREAEKVGLGEEGGEGEVVIAEGGLGRCCSLRKYIVRSGMHVDSHHRSVLNGQTELGVVGRGVSGGLDEAARTAPSSK